MPQLLKKGRRVIRMKEKELSLGRNKRGALLWMVMAACLALTGCAATFGPILLNKEVRQYDDKVLQSEEQLLLLNIIRMHDGQPAHFTAASGVQATFSLSHSGTLNPMYSSNRADVEYSGSGLSLSKTVTDNPTITIAPMQGKDFAQRLLNPIDTTFVNTLFLQRSAPRLDKVLRLICKNFYMMPPEYAKKVFELIPAGIDPQEKIDKYTYPYDISSFPDPKNQKEVEEWEKNNGFKSDEAPCLLSSLINDGYTENYPGKIPENRTREDTKDTFQYKIFRKVVSHIQAMALANLIYFFYLDFDVPIVDHLKIDKDVINLKDSIDEADKKYFWETTEEARKNKSCKEKKEEKKEEGEEEEEGFMLADEANVDVNGSFMPAHALKGRNMKGITDALGRQYHWEKRPNCEKKESFKITKRYQIVAITDFDFDSMTDEHMMSDKAKIELFEKLRRDLDLKGEIALNEGMIIVMLRGDKKQWPKNHWPIYGYFTLRNFKLILQFLAESLVKDKPEYASEYDVPPSQFTLDLVRQFTAESPTREKQQFGCLENPALTLTIHSEPTSSKNRLLDVDYNGKLFWISSPQDQTGTQPQPKEDDNPCVNLEPRRWDSEVFSLLYEIYQFNNIAPPVSPPAVSISK
jgi:hypothetical protein